MQNGHRYMRSQVFGSRQSRGLEGSGPGRVLLPASKASVRRCAQFSASSTRRACLIKESAAHLGLGESEDVEGELDLRGMIGGGGDETYIRAYRLGPMAGQRGLA